MVDIYTFDRIELWLDLLDAIDAEAEWSALDELVYAASDDDTDPRKWTGVC